MIGTGIDVRVKIQDIISSQLPEFILNESPLTEDFLKQFYVSQEAQGASVDIVSNLDQYLDLNILSKETVAGEYVLEKNIGETDSEVFVNNTKAFPNEWGLFKIDEEIFTYTGITTNSFTGVVRGFSGITSYRDHSNPSEVTFESSEASSHKKGAAVENLSSLFLKEFYKKLKYTFAPGFEDLEFNSEVNVGNWIQQARSFYQTKGSIESIEILFKVLYGEDPTVIDLERFLIKSSEAEFSRRDYAVGTVVQGNPVGLKGKTIFQSDAFDVFGAVSEIEPFERDGVQYYRIYFFVSNDEIGAERKLFTVPGKTKVHRAWNPGDATITVDTTVGFRRNNEFITADGTKFKYEERTVNQFLGVTCEDPTKSINVGDDIIDDITVFGTDDDGNRVILRLTGTLSDIDFGDGIPFTNVDEKIRVDTLGENIVSSLATNESQTYKQIVANSLIYNTKVRFQVLDVSGSNFNLATPFIDKTSLRVGDRVDVLRRGSEQILLGDRLITNIDPVGSTVTIDDSFGLDPLAVLDIRRIQKYATSKETSIDYGDNNILSNVLNLYDATEYDSNLYVATNSLPSYEIDVAIIESKISGITTNNFADYDSFEDNYATLIFDEPVEFITGDLLTYSVLPGIGSTVSFPVCAEGEYFVEVLADPRRIRLYLSPSFIGSANYVGLDDNEEPGTHIFTLESQKNRIINTQRTYRKIPVSGNDQNVTVDRTPVKVDPGTIAILTNGVEIISYQSPDKVYLGPIVSIEPVGKGQGYSAISPPKLVVDEPDLQLTDPTPPVVNADRALATPVIRGFLEQIQIDPQDFDIDKVFSINVKGGNSRGATAKPQIERRRRSIPFDTRIDTFGGGINPIEETIQFLIEHKLPKGEPIVYNNRGFISIGIAEAGGSNSSGTSLANGGVYFAEPVNNKTIRIYPSLDDLNAGINTVGLTSNFTGLGIQSFDTLSKNRLVGATIQEDGGEFFYRNLEFKPANVYIEYDEIRYNNHGFSTGDLVEYKTTETPIAGLSTELKYLVYAPDENTMQLAAAGEDGKDRFDFEREDWVKLDSVGVGTHTIKYEDITAEVVVSYASTITGIVTATPYVRGEIAQVYVNEGGYYGSDILNFQKNPEIEIVGGIGARIKPVIVLGQVLGVQILNKGRNYPLNPDVIVEDSTGAGRGAVLRAIVTDGEVEDVLILTPGIGYNPDTTSIKVIDPGKDAILTPRIRNLTVNLNTRFGFEGLVDNDYSVVSYDRKIREDVYDDFGFTHSPIIGWANDGNPIYGGFALDDPEDFNSGFRAMQTSYKLDLTNVRGRPSLNKYAAGFFVEDYKYNGAGDLDEYNGRYCRTPEFPNGVYAYFAGISTDTQSLAREPQFPYFIGPEYRDAPIRTSSGDVDQDFEINDKPFFRNTFPYVVGDPTAGSEFFDQSYLFDIQDTIIESIQNGRVESVNVIGIGQSYRVGDVPVFSSEEDNLSSIVSELSGKPISSIDSEILSYKKDFTNLVRLDKDTVRVYVDSFHEYLDNDTVIFGGLSTNTTRLQGPQKISVDNARMTLFSPVTPLPQLIAPSTADVFVNAISPTVSVGSSVRIGIGSTAETCEVINIFPVNKALRVVRPVGYAFTNFIGFPVDVVPNYFDIEVKTENFENNRDEKYYFNPRQTVSLGIETGTTYSTDYIIGNISKTISLPVGSIYAPSHKFRNDELVTLSRDPNDDDITANDGNQLYSVPGGLENTYYISRISKNLIGIKTSPDGNNLRFGSNGSDSPLYNIKTDRYKETVSLDRIQAIVKTTSPHQMNSGDKIDVSLIAKGNSGIGSNDTVVVRFDEISQSLVIDPQFAEPTGIDTQAGLIRIDRHGYILGDRVLYENYGTPMSGIATHEKYFVIPFDSDRFQLAETFIDIKPGDELPIKIENVGVGSHTFSLVNPKIGIVKKNNIEFDIGDESLFGKELKFFYDQTQTEIFENNGIDSDFVVTGVSTEGYSGARKFLQYSDNNPDVIYYGLDIGGYISTSDTLTQSYNSIEFIDSAYQLRTRATVLDEDTFSYSLLRLPEESDYNTSGIDVSYTTSSKTAFGGVGKVKIISSGNNFTTLPEYLSIDSEFGTNATLRAVSDDVGKLSSFRIQNPGWAYSADRTLSPKGLIQPKVEFTDSDFVTDISVIDGGSGYQQPPNAVLIDAVTREEINNGSIEIEVQSSTVSNVIVDVAPSGLAKNSHELYTINNSNGIPILLVEDVDRVSGVVTFAIQTPIQGYFIDPFEVGDQVFVENIIPEVGEDDLNLNSAEYGYRFFNVVTVLDSGGPLKIGVQYPPELADQIGVAVTFQGAFSSMVNRKLYPTFSIEQATAIFIEGERLSIINEQGIAQETDLVVEESNTNFFKFRGNFNVLVGDVLKGNISGVIVTVTNIEKSECRYIVNAISRVNNGWNDQTGFLNEEFQVVSDNDYYQKLSYSIKSTINFEDLIGPVNRLVHPAGMKNFSDTKIEGSGSVGFGATSNTSITLDFIGLTDRAETPLRVDRINVFDLGYDNEVNENRSNAIRFNSRTPNKRLTDFIEVRTNRVLLHDDISSQFIDRDNIADQDEYIDFNIVSGEYTRAVLQARNPFTDQVELTEVVLLAYDNNSYTLTKAFVADNGEGYGTFEGVALNSTEYTLRYKPNDIETFDYDFKLFSNKFIFEDESFATIGYARLGGENKSVEGGSSTRVYTALNSGVTGAGLNVQVIDENGKPYYAEVYAVKLGSETRWSVYSFNAENFTGFSEDFPGEFSTIINNGRLAINYTNRLATKVLITTKSTEFLDVPGGVNPYRFKRDSIPNGTERGVNLESATNSDVAGSSQIEVIRFNADLVQSLRILVNVQGADVASIQQLMVINSDGSTHVTSYPFLVEGEDLDPRAGIGSFGADIVGSDMVVYLYPDAQINPTQVLEVTSYSEVFFRELDNVNYINKPLIHTESEETYYIDRYIAPQGPRTNNTRFTLTYQEVPIYEKEFNPPEVISDLGTFNIFNIPDHFFSPAEELYYEPGTSVKGEPFEAIGIANTVVNGIGTDKLPSTVYAVKRDLGRFSLALTQEDAVRGNIIDIVGFGTGNQHRIGMKKKLEKTIITIDGVIQSPISTANKTYELAEDAQFEEEFLALAGIGTLTIGDLLQVDKEYMRIKNVGFGTEPDGPINNIGSFPLIEVERGVVGSAATDHVVGAAMTLYRGSYNLVGSDIIFTEAPSGKGALSINESNLVELNSSFQGRTFLQKEYDTIAVFDDISDEFDGKSNEFRLTSAGSTTGEIQNGSGVLIINDIYQTPTTDNNQGNNYFYSYDANTGINTVTFTGITSSNGLRVLSEFDVNQNQVPRGGLIVSLGSTPGLGYAPLVGAQIKAEIVAGEIVGIVTVNQIGVTTAIEHAVYDKENGELIVTANGPAVTAKESISGVQYNNVSGQLTIQTPASLSFEGVKEGDSIRLEGLEFNCTSSTATTNVIDATYDETTGIVRVTTDSNSQTSVGNIVRLGGLTFDCTFGTSVYPRPSVEGTDFAVTSIISPTVFEVEVGVSTLAHTYVSGGTATVGITTTVFPDKDNTFAVISVVNNNTFALDVGVSTIPHTYAGGGTWQKMEQFEFGEDGYRPQFVYLDGLEFNCPNGETVGLTTTTFPVGNDHFPLVFGDDKAHWRILVGVSTIVHSYASGGTIGQYNKFTAGSGYNEPVSIAVTEAGHIGTGAVIEGIPRAGGELEFVITNPGSGYTSPYLSAPDPVYENLPIKGIFRRSNPIGAASTPTGDNLFVTCEVGAATTIAVGRSEFFEISNYEITNQGFSFMPGDIIEPVGLVTDKRLAIQGLGPIEPFQLTVLETFTDNFSAWNFGELNYIDSIKPLQNGTRTRFPLFYKGELFSFEKDPTDEDSAAIDLDSILLIFVNTVLQVPVLNYTFNGGTTFQFTSAPFPEDEIDIYFYRAKPNIDSIEVTEVDESIRPGDELQIKKNDAINKKTSFDNRTRTQDLRTVTQIQSSDTVRTNIYFGNNDLETVRPRQVAWDKQKRDIFIYGEPFSKARDSLEPVIQPTSSIIRTLPATDIDKADVEIFTDNSILYTYEEDQGDTILTKIDSRIYRGLDDDFEEAQFTAIVNTSGEISNIAVPNRGSGYVDGSYTLIIPPPSDGVRAVARVSMVNGQVFGSPLITNDGSGYSQTNPPTITLPPPSLQYEDIENIETIEGFTGIITGIQREASFGTDKIKFSYRTNVDNAVELRPGYSLVVNNTVVGNGIVATTDSISQIVGVGTNNLDCVYQISNDAGSVGNIGRNGFFIVNVSNNSGVPPQGVSGLDLGQFSWGRLTGISRDIDKALNYVVDGTTFTSDMRNYPSIVRRAEGLRNEGGLAKKLVIDN